MIGLIDETSGANGPAGCGPSITQPAIQYPEWSTRTGKFVRGVDTFYLCLWVSFSPSSWAVLLPLLDAAKKDAQSRRESAFVEFQGQCIEVSPRGSEAGFGFPFRLTIDGVGLLVSRRGEVGATHNAMAIVGGASMTNLGLAFSLGKARVWRIVEALGGVIEKHTISRLDPAVDLIDVESRKFLKVNRWVCRAHHRAVFRSVDYDEFVESFEKARSKGKAAYMRKAEELYDNLTKRGIKRLTELAFAGVADSITFGSGKKACGMQFGRGDRVVRIYDKSEQLLRRHPERYEEMLLIWGCPRGTPVTRIEFQLRGDGLRDAGIVTIDDAIEKLPALVDYLVNQWCVGCGKYDGTNQVKTIHRLWARVQDAFTSTPGLEPWEVAQPAASVNVDDGFGPQGVALKRAEQYEKTAMTYLMKAAIRRYGASVGDVSDICGALRETVENGITRIGSDRLFPAYNERLIQHWNQNGRETGSEVWRVPRSSWELIDQPDHGIGELAQMNIVGMG